MNLLVIQSKLPRLIWIDLYLSLKMVIALLILKVMVAVEVEELITVEVVVSEVVE